MTPNPAVFVIIGLERADFDEKSKEVHVYTFDGSMKDDLSV